jgi:hypothetical protein
VLPNSHEGSRAMLLSVEQLEVESGISRHTCRERRIAHVRPGRRVLVARADYGAFVRARRVDVSHSQGTAPTLQAASGLHKQRLGGS